MVRGHCFVTLPLTINETLKRFSLLPIWMQESFWWSQYSFGYSSPSPPLPFWDSAPPPPSTSPETTRHYTSLRNEQKWPWGMQVNTIQYLQSSMPSPPFPHSLLKRRMPVTIMVSSSSCLSLSRFVRFMKEPSSVWGKTDWRAAASVRQGRNISINMLNNN